MCGIAGILNGSGSARAMIEALTHRGPDGIRIEEGENRSLAHARLSIIDLEGGWQPLHAAGSTVIGNGEIYNYVELSAEHGLKGRLATGSDFEPLLHLYNDKWEDALGLLRGMYALCLSWQNVRTVLARDPFGIKPLYYVQKDRRIAFASEPRALFAGAEALPELKHGKAEELLALNYTLGTRTIFKDVWRLAPGDERCNTSSGWGSGEGQSARERGWHLRAPGRAFTSEDDAIAQLDAILEDSVRVHQRSDVPYGLFLSGGIDSAAIASLMSRLNERPVVAFTCGFDVPGAADERAQAERVARALNLDWREVSFGEEDFWRILPQIAWTLDDPTTDFATLPTYKLAEAAKGTLTVVLTGEGGDELFGGYGRYRRALRPGWLGGRPAEPQVDAPFLKDGGAGALARWRQAGAAPNGLTPLQRAQWADIQTWLPNDLLLKLDRCLMAHGLEGRTPFLDREVAAFAFNLPDRMKVRGRHGKWLLRQWLERVCPAAQPWARKQGFTVPVAAWIAPRARDLGPRIAGSPGVRAVCDPDAVRAVFDDDRHAKTRWPLLFFAVWHAIHLEGATPADALTGVLGE
jgi:asparagine synthase (glutamine-hydrolysing)